MRRPRVLPLAGLVLGVALLVGGWMLWQRVETGTSEAPVVGVAFSLLMGLLIVLRKPGTTIGMLLVVLGLAGCCQYFFEGYWWAFGAPSADPGDATIWAVKTSGAAATIGFAGMLVFMPILFPDGRPHTRWSQLLLVISLVFVSFQSGTMLLSGQDLCVVEEPDSTVCLRLIEDPPGIPWLPSAAEDPLQLVFGPLIVFSIVGGLTAAVSRFRRSTGEVRAQMKWFALGALATVLVIPPAIVLNSLFGVVYPQWVFNVPYILMPAGVAIAVLKYHLYDIDRVVSRTVTYAAVVTVLGLAVAGVAAVAGTQFDEPWVVAATTLAVAAAFNPLRRKIQGWVDRRFNRSRYVAQRVIDDFSDSLQKDLDRDHLVSGWLGVVSETMHPASAGVWIKE